MIAFAQEIVSSLYASTLSSLQSNQFLTGGLVLGFIGGILVYMRRVPVTIYSLLKRKFIVSVEILNNDDSYEWVSRWFNQSLYYEKTNLLSVTSIWPGGGKKPVIIYSPGIGFHIMWRNGWPIWFTKEREDGQTTDIERKESYMFKTFKFAKQHLKDFISEVRDARYNDKDGIRVFTPDGYGSWHDLVKLDTRDLGTIYLPEGELDNLITDIETFKDNKDFYKNRGIPYRRGYLFHGLPGTGKSSTIHALATHLGMDIYILRLSNMKMTDDSISNYISEVPDGQLIVIEDIDTFNSAKTRKIERNKKDNEELFSTLTISGLLNAIDGIGSQEGRIIIMTTNYKDKLDDALIRPGRIDVQLEFTYADTYQIQSMLKRFYPGVSEYQIHDAVDAIDLTKENITIADLQARMIQHETVRGFINSFPGRIRLTNVV